MAEIKYRKIVSTESGIGGTRGQETAKFFNENFEVTKQNLEAIWSIIELVVQSHNIEGIRIRPVYDPDDESLENGKWYPVEVLFENIVGDINQNPQLKRALEDLTPLARFLPTEAQVQTNTSNIEQHEGRINVLENTSAEHDVDIKDLQDLTEQHSIDLRLKVNQVLERFVITEKGTNYKAGVTIYDETEEHVLTVDSVDSVGGITSVSMSLEDEPDPLYITINAGGENYKVGDIIEATGGWNARVTLVDANGAILEAEKTEDPISEDCAGVGGSIVAASGSGAVISTTTYPTIYLQSVNNGQYPRLIFYLNNDLNNPYEIVGYPEFANVINIIAEDSTYYELWVTADSANAEGYGVGDTFTIDGTDYSGQIVDISSDPYAITTDIPETSMIDLSGSYSVTATSGTGSGLEVVINSVFHPQQTTNEEFNRYMSNYTEYVQSLIDASLEVLENTLRALIDSKVDQADFDGHLNDFNNPHQVDKAQLGLSDVDNTSDLDKPISNAVQYELNTLRQALEDSKQPSVISTSYFKYLGETAQVDPSILYFVGNLNITWINRVDIDESDITSPYNDNELLSINGTDWQILILDTSVEPILYSTTVPSTAEADISGSYDTTSINGNGEGLKVVVTSIQR